MWRLTHIFLVLLLVGDSCGGEDDGGVDEEAFVPPPCEAVPFLQSSSLVVSSLSLVRVGYYVRGWCESMVALPPMSAAATVSILVDGVPVARQLRGAQGFALIPGGSAGDHNVTAVVMAHEIGHTFMGRGVGKELEQIGESGGSVYFKSLDESEDIQFLFPPQNFTFDARSRIVLAVAVTARSLSRFPTAAKLVFSMEDSSDDKVSASSVEMPLARHAHEGTANGNVHVDSLAPGHYQGVAHLVDDKGNSLEVASRIKFNVEKSVATSADAHSPLSVLDDPTCDTKLCDAGDKLVCSGHGSCQKGACWCDVDWMGPACECNVLTHSSCLPRLDPSGYKALCSGSRQWRNATAWLLQEWTAVWDSGRDAPSYRCDASGAGSALLCLATLGLASLNKAVPVRVLGPSGWRYRRQRRTLSGFDSFLNTPVRPAPLDLGRDQFMRVRPSTYYWYRQKSTPGLLWAYAQMFALLVQPSSWLQRDVSAAVAAVQLPVGCIGVHIRHGDACSWAEASGNRPHCVASDVYWSAALHMATQYGARCMFVATDDAQALRDVEDAGVEQGIDIFSYRIDRSDPNVAWGGEEYAGKGFWDDSVVMKNSLVDLLLLRRCSYFVGAFSSQFSRAAYALIVARVGVPVPFQSIDYPWGQHYLEERAEAEWVMGKPRLVCAPDDPLCQ